MTEEEQQAMMQQVAAPSGNRRHPRQRQRPRQLCLVGAGDSAGASGDPAAGFVEDDPTTWGNPGRNDACPCGSGKKFKHCHGKL